MRVTSARWVAHAFVTARPSRFSRPSYSSLSRPLSLTLSPPVSGRDTATAAAGVSTRARVLWEGQLAGGREFGGCGAIARRCGTTASVSPRDSSDYLRRR